MGSSCERSKFSFCNFIIIKSFQIFGYISVLRRQSKPIKFNKYIPISSEISDLDNIQLVGSAGDHTIEIKTATQEEDIVMNVSMVIFRSHKHLGGVVCHVSPGIPSCQHKSFVEVGPDAIYMNTTKSYVIITIIHKFLNLG